MIVCPGHILHITTCIIMHLHQDSKKTWKKHGHKKGFDPTAYAQQRKAAIEQANLARWQPTQWSAVPSSCYKPSADAHHNGEWD